MKKLNTKEVNTTNNTDICKRKGVYKISDQNFDEVYIGMTNVSFRIRSKEYMNNFIYHYHSYVFPKLWVDL